MVVQHNENITKTLTRGLVMTYTKKGDCGNQTVVVTKMGKDRYRLTNTYDGQTEKNDLIYSKEALMRILNGCSVREDLQFMIDYLVEYE